MSRIYARCCLAAGLLAAAAPALAEVWAGGRQQIVSPTPEATPFGLAVATLDFDGDGDLEVAIGDTGAQNDGPDPSVRIYASNGGDWDLLETISLDDVRGFGAVLAVGDFDASGTDDLLIGAPMSASGGGSVYYARRPAEGPSQLNAVFHTDGAMGGGCGTSLAVGDFDDDGHLDFATGCPWASFDAYVGAGRVGVAYGFGDGSFLVGTYFHQASSGVSGGPEDGDAFGASLAVGDFFCDGIDDLAIGAPGEDVDGAIDNGAIHVLPGVAETGLTGTGSQLWHQGSTGVPGLSEEDDAFGAALAGGDFDRGLIGPYCDDLAIGIPGDVESPGGAVLVLFGTHEGLVAAGAQRFDAADFPEPSDPGSSHRIGHALAAGQLDGDFAEDLAISALGVSEGIGPPPIGPEPGAPTLQEPGIACVLYGSGGGGLGEGICFSGASGEFIEKDQPGPVLDQPAAGDADVEDPAFGSALAIGPFDRPEGSGLVLGSPGNREVFVLQSALFADGFELPGTDRWSAVAGDLD